MATFQVWRRNFLESLKGLPWRRILLSGLWFFLILVAYYLLKPLRDASASPAAEYLNYLYIATFVATLLGSAAYSFVVSRTDRRRLIFFLTQFFVACLGLFLVVLDWQAKAMSWPGVLFFVWASVFNIFAVAMFWSVMADIYHTHESKQCFGLIAAGGSLGSIFGSFVAKYLASFPAWIFVASIVCLELAWLTSLWLTSKSDRVTAVRDASDGRIGGSFWGGLRSVVASRYLGAICLYVILGKFAATFLYNNLQTVVKAEVPLYSDRIELFASMNLWTQTGSLLAQGLAVGLIMRFAGVGLALLLPGLTLMVVFGWLSFESSLTVLVIAQVTQQIVGYGFMTPAQHVLFSVVPREEKYQSKGFMDTVVFRFSDVAASNVCKGMDWLKTSLSLLSATMIPWMIVWVGLAIFLGREHQRRTEANASHDHS
jgi:ATP:ADP antiporter, AAA family